MSKPGGSKPIGRRVSKHSFSSTIEDALTEETKERLTEKMKEMLELTKIRARLSPQEAKVASENKWCGKLLVAQRWLSPTPSFLPGMNGSLIVQLVGKERQNSFLLNVSFTLAGPHERKENFRIVNVEGWPYENNFTYKPTFTVASAGLTKNACYLLIENIYAISKNRPHDPVINFENGITKQNNK